MSVSFLAMADRISVGRQSDLLVVVGRVGRIGDMCLAVWIIGANMVNRLIRWAVTCVMVAALCFAFYRVGQKVGESRAKVQIVEKQIEVIKCVEKKKAVIQSLPNAGRDDLLKLMRNGKL